MSGASQRLHRWGTDAFLVVGNDHRGIDQFPVSSSSDHRGIDQFPASSSSALIDVLISFPCHLLSATRQFHVSPPVDVSW